MDQLRFPRVGAALWLPIFLDNYVHLQQTIGATLTCLQISCWPFGSAIGFIVFQGFVSSAGSLHVKMKFQKRMIAWVCVMNNFLPKLCGAVHLTVLAIKLWSPQLENYLQYVTERAPRCCARD
jgi:hypothetical protein